MAQLGIEALELKIRGYSGADIARLYHTEPNHVGAWISRAKAKLKKDAAFMAELLKKAELVMESKYKNFVYYELNTSVVEEIMLWLSELRGKEDYEEFKETDNRNNSSGADSLSGGSDSVEPPAGTGAHSLEF